MIIERKLAININKLDLGFDYDNVLFNSSECFVDLFNEYTGCHYTMNDLTDWDMKKCFPTEYAKLVDDLWFSPRLWNRIEPITDARLYLNILCKEENVLLVTNTHWDILSPKVARLKKCYPFFNTDNIYTGKDKSKFSLDVLTDDATHNLIHGKYKKILMSYRWNQNFNCSQNGVRRADNFTDIYTEIQRIKESERQIFEMMN